mmetsp:Transcript_99188/g.285317  ORF Transcript_99188/g.285317 Transcript_99188/m.285317 type:complete len:84 (+) Transcript_99188:646-897(+)
MDARAKVVLSRAILSGSISPARLEAALAEEGRASEGAEGMPKQQRSEARARGAGGIRCEDAAAAAARAMVPGAARGARAFLRA